MNRPDDLGHSLESGSRKVRPDHLERAAYVYIRQSTLKQVAENCESQRNQRRMTMLAVRLGWTEERVHVIDEDQGLSGSGSVLRNGFQRLVTEVSLGHVGIIIGYEVSRLARNNGDWYHLLDLAGVFRTLIADNDGVYDPRRFNDRLLLGLKGTMSEAELHLLKQRLEAGRMRQIERGAYRQNLPTGLVRASDGRVELDPDSEVRARIRLVLQKFAELGSCSRVLRFFRREGFTLPRRQARGPHKGQIIWKPATHTAIYEIVRNPAYAGAFVYGRKQTERRACGPGQVQRIRARKDQASWVQIKHDVYPSYISWEAYEANQARLHQNATRYFEKGAPGAARDGAALLQGLVVCGHCGYRRQVNYKATAYTYQCHGAYKRTGAPRCPNVHGPRIDAMVVATFFEALAPAHLDTLAAVLEAQHAEQQEREAQWALRLERAKYEAQRAERQYQHVEPENRRVAAELERRWEQQLQQLATVQEEWHRRRTRRGELPALTEALKKQFRQLSAHLPEVWERLTVAERKELLRSLIAHVILTRDMPDLVKVRIVWVSGCCTERQVIVPTGKREAVRGYAAMVARIGELYRQGLGDQEIAAQLEREGFHTAHRLGVAVSTVRDLRQEHGWHHRTGPRPTKIPAGYLTTTDVAQRLQVDRTWVYRRLRNGTIDAMNFIRDTDTNHYLIRDSPELMAQLRVRIGKRTRSSR